VAFELLSPMNQSNWWGKGSNLSETAFEPQVDSSTVGTENSRAVLQFRFLLQGGALRRDRTTYPEVLGLGSSDMAILLPPLHCWRSRITSCLSFAMKA